MVLTMIRSSNDQKAATNEAKEHQDDTVGKLKRCAVLRGSNDQYNNAHHEGGPKDQDLEGP